MKNSSPGENISNYLHRWIDGRFSGPYQNIKFKRASGGSINEAYVVETDVGNFFFKVNSLSQYPGMFDAESRGLELLRTSGTFRIPEVHSVDSAGDDALLLMEYIKPGAADLRSEEQIGFKLAELHQITTDHFGLDHDNYIGSLPQSNSNHQTWQEFFIVERLEPQFRLALEKGHFNTTVVRKISSFYNKLENLIPRELPALVHGDLWSGNYIIDDQGQPVLIDPAVYFGHREMDISMMQLFGGFPASVFEAYNSEFPLEKGWRERTDLHNLYPLLVHVNLFGGSYEQQAAAVINRYV